MHKALHCTAFLVYILHHMFCCLCRSLPMSPRSLQLPLQGQPLSKVSGWRRLMRSLKDKEPNIGWKLYDVIEAHCYIVDTRGTDCEQICSRINNNWCRTFRLHRPLSTAYKTESYILCWQLRKRSYVHNNVQMLVWTYVSGTTPATKRVISYPTQGRP